MARNYNGFGSAAVGTNKTILTLVGAATVRPRLHQILVGSVATPGDQATDFRVQRFTAAGTEGSGFTPIALDPADPASLCDCGVGTFGAEPTYTANAVLMQFSLNQQATFMWVAAPGRELVLPPTASNGVGIKSASSTSTQVTEACFHWEE